MRLSIDRTANFQLFGSPSPQIDPGELLLGRYRCDTIIGRGGMANVYRGFDELLRRPVAIKILRAELALNPPFRLRFEQEARAIATVSHPNVVGVYDAGDDRGRSFIVMELVSGGTLANRIANGPLDQALIRRIGSAVLDALAAAHGQRVLHGDIKPANVLITDDETAKVVDFGIAKALALDGVELATVNGILGTPSYLAPERVRGEPADFAADLWAVGVILYECLTGTRPFTGNTPIALAISIQEGRYTPVSELRPDADSTLVEVVERALQTDPSRRFDSAEQMAYHLRLSPVNDESVDTVAVSVDNVDYEATRRFDTPIFTTELSSTSATVIVDASPQLCPLNTEVVAGGRARARCIAGFAVSGAAAFGLLVALLISTLAAPSSSARPAMSTDSTSTTTIKLSTTTTTSAPKTQHVR